MCDNSTTLNNYDYYFDQIFMMPKSMLVKTTKCLLPCVFTEFKVSLVKDVASISIRVCTLVHFKQMTEDAITVGNVNRANGTGLVLFLSDSVEVLTEEKSFPFGSLVADCGGVLGLFIGFNFLMIWDWIMKCLKI